MQTTTAHKFLDTKSFQYWPFVAVTVLAATTAGLLAMLTNSNGEAFWHSYMNSFMGCFFIFLALPKLYDIGGFAQLFSQYDIVAKRSLSYAKLYPIIELALGMLFVTSVTMSSLLANILLNTLVVVITSISITSLLLARRQKQPMTCACLGSAFKLPLSNVTLIENILMLVMSLAMIVLAHPAGHMMMGALL